EIVAGEAVQGRARTFRLNGRLAGVRLPIADMGRVLAERGQGNEERQKSHAAIITCRCSGRFTRGAMRSADPPSWRAAPARSTRARRLPEATASPRRKRVDPWL